MFFFRDGYSVSQSIGQQSMGGCAAGIGFIVQQGFQQSLFSQIVLNQFNKSIEVKVFPNPFVSEFVIEFNSDVVDNVEVRLYDVLGKLVFSSTGIPQERHLIIKQFTNLPEGHYYLSLVSYNFKVDIQLIKR